MPSAPLAVRAVLFDLDGTLADTAADLAAALNRVRADHALPPLPLEVLRPHASHGARGLLGAGFGIGRESPEFEPLRAASEALGVDAAQCVYVGDAERDIVAGRAAGMKTLIASYGYLGDDDT